MTKLFCTAPFYSAFVNSQGHMAPCAQWPRAWDMSIAQWSQSPELKEIQDRFIRDNWFQPECAKCEYHATRSSTYDWHMHQLRDPNKFHIDFTPDNQCNLSCLMCSPELSTGVGREYQKIGWIQQVPKIDNYDRLLAYLDEIDRKDLDIVVCGGEPFMNTRFADILELIRDRGWSVYITTNGSLRHDRAMQALRGIKQATLEISADGVGSSYEAIRWPMTWDKWTKNFDYYADHIAHRKVNSISIRYVINFFNAHDYAGMCNFARSKKVITHPCLLSWPEWLTWSVLTDQERATVVELVERSRDTVSTQLHQDYLDQIIAHVKSHELIPKIRQEFLTKYRAICQHRGHSPGRYLSHLPTLQAEFDALP